MPYRRKISLAAVLLVMAALTLACGLQVGVQDDQPKSPEREVQTSPLPLTERQPATSTPAGISNTPDIPTLPPTENAPTPEGEAPEDHSLRVVYVKDENIWLWDESGKQQVITSSGGVLEVRISPDGALVAFTRRVDDLRSELWVVNADGSEERLLVGVNDFEALDPEQRDPNSVALSPHRFDWVPGTHLLVFNTVQWFQGPGLGNFDDLRQVDVVSGALTTLLPAGQGGDFTYSPDGSQVALVTPEQISLMNADGSHLRPAVLTYEPVLTYSEYLYYAEPVWAQDSSFLMAAIPPADPMAEPLGPTRLYRIPVDVSPAVEVGSVTAFNLGGFGVNFSPDLVHIAYLRPVGQPPDNAYELHVASSDGTNDNLFLTETNLLLHGWTADPQRFFFSMGPAMEMQIGSVGGGHQPLAGSAQGVFQLRWIDPERYLYLQENAGAIELRLGQLNGEHRLIDSLPGGLPLYDFSD